MEQANPEVLPIKPGLLLDILDQKPSPALSSTNDMPVIETKPDSVAEKPLEKAVPLDDESKEAEQLEESATSTTETPGQPTAGSEKVARGVGKKIAELTKRIDEAETRAKQAEENLKLALEATKKVEPEPAGEDLVKPTRDSFSDPDAYDQAILEYADKRAELKAKQEVERMRSEEAEKARKVAEETTARARLDAYNARVEKARQTHADFEEVAQSPDVQVPIPVVHAIMTHEQGPEIQYYLGKNPQEAQRLMSYTVETPQGTQPDVARQLMEVGLIVAKLNAPQVTPTISKAAPPIKPLKSAPMTEEKDPSEMNMDEYKAWRKTQRH
jgi:hypothetical protein